MGLFARPLPLTSAFPELTAGQLLRYSFRGLLSVHSRYSLHTRQVALKRPSTPEASVASLPPPLLRLLPGGANQFPGGTFPAVDQRLFTAHVNCYIKWFFLAFGVLTHFRCRHEPPRARAS